MRPTARNTQEVDNAKSKRNECNRFSGRWDSDGDIDRGCDDGGRFAANNGQPGDGEKDRPAMRKMPHDAA